MYGEQKSVNIDTYCHSGPLGISFKPQSHCDGNPEHSNCHSEPLGEESHANPNCHSEDEVRRISFKPC